MTALWVLTRLRMLEVVPVPSTCFLFFGLPLFLFVLVAVLFANGHPFERRRLAVVGSSPFLSPSQSLSGAAHRARAIAGRGPRQAPGPPDQRHPGAGRQRLALDKIRQLSHLT